MTTRFRNMLLFNFPRGSVKWSSLGRIKYDYMALYRDEPEIFLTYFASRTCSVSDRSFVRSFVH